ncbi:response regulator transcription factor [Mucilaginibacter aquaedulcis]|uniref:response regulator transcription factor n=1 Tax=Mucilaginibacter aquaedulcis TaxID=1187081 RepID=UPI0025B4975C|nr:response regulator transcription factor [Mucilaginibacter aquaedulcis]MDN3550031.1 response regulator transcription factor [Mucilaginibacter aquaedulcis]
MIKIAVFDDHQARREALKLLIDLHPDMEMGGEYTDCSNLIRNIKNNTPDVVLMDIHMPGIDGLAGVKLLKTHFPHIHVIMQTVFDDDDNLFQCLLAGADGYILKKTPNDQLIAGIMEVVGGGAPMTPSIARRVLQHFSTQSIKKNKAQAGYELSKREIDVLSCLVKGSSQKMIAAELFISVFTVNNHMKNIYQKMQVHNVSEAVATAIQKNIV